MKLWFPNATQWAVMWLGLVIFSVALANALSYRTEGWAMVVFVLVAVLFLLWMLEGRKRNAKSKDDAAE